MVRDAVYINGAEGGRAEDTREAGVLGEGEGEEERSGALPEEKADAEDSPGSERRPSADGDGDGKGGPTEVVVMVDEVRDDRATMKDPLEELEELKELEELAARPGNVGSGAEEGLAPVEETVVPSDVGKKVKVKTPPTLANTYAAKKTVAQGMMDIALITSNANQLRYVIVFADHDTMLFRLNASLIVISILLQIAIGVTLIFKGRADLGGAKKLAHANRLNNYVVGGVFLVTIINVFVSAFSVSPPTTTAAAAAPSTNIGVL